MYPVRVRVALVHDWLTAVGGSERVLLDLHELFPDAPIFTAAFDPSRTLPQFRELDIRTSFLQRPLLRADGYGRLIPLMPMAFASFDTRAFDVLVVSSHTAAKGIRKQPGQAMICYCHTPMRWAWDLYDFYLQHRATTPLARISARAILTWFRRWDRRSAHKVDEFIANSQTVRHRISRYYGRESAVVWPPVDCARFTPTSQHGNHFLVVSRLEDHKRVDIVVDAFTQLGWPLQVAGDGPQRAALQHRAGPNVTFLGRLDDSALATAYAGAGGIVFPADEDAGIVPLEAMAAGRPVLALKAGGAVEVVRDGVSGAFFLEQTVDSLVAALRAFQPDSYDPAAIRAIAEPYDRHRFREAIGRIVDAVAGTRR